MNRKKIAVFGGRGDHAKSFKREFKNAKIKSYMSPGDGSYRDTQRLIESIKQYSFDLVIILTRWNSHTATKMVTRECKKYNVPYEMRT